MGGQALAAWPRGDMQCARCPRTSEVLDSMSLVRVRDHAPETLYSVLRPGTHILIGPG
jgi:aspartate beta-hydroxylase